MGWIDEDEDEADVNVVDDEDEIEEDDGGVQLLEALSASWSWMNGVDQGQVGIAAVELERWLDDCCSWEEAE
jgi:hypothetical protein